MVIPCWVDKIQIDFVIDSGSPINAITQNDWNHLKEAKAHLKNVRVGSGRRFQAYASQQPLEILHTFEARVSVNEQKPTVEAEFMVVAKAKRALLSRQTSEDLKLLKVGLEVNKIKESCAPFPAFPNVLVRIEVDPTVKPKQTPYFRIPAPIMEEVMGEIQKLIDLDIIEQAPNPCNWISPMIVVPKADGGFRLCVDMRAANKAIKREPFPMPTIETCLNKLSKATIFSKIDLEKAFHHVKLAEESRDITTFMTPRGPMRYKRLMFGLNCAPEIFQRIMFEMLVGCEGTINFIDEIAIAGTAETHDGRLEKVMKILKENNATLNRNKCSFGLKEIQLLGFTVSGKGIRPSNEKVEAIRNFREPKTGEEVRRFLGLVQFVGHFIPNLATKAEPLRKMMRREVKEFGPEQKEAFDELRLLLSKTCTELGFYDPKDETELYADASPWGLGAVLVQKKNDVARIISYASKSLTKSERKLPQTQREAMSVPWSVERFHFYLFGLHFTLYTDHKTLEFIFNGKHQTGKRACTRAESFALRLQAYDFEVKFIKHR